MILTIVALLKRGVRLRSLLTGRVSYRTTYLMRSAEGGEVTFLFVIVCHYAAGGRGRQEIEYPLRRRRLGTPRVARPPDRRRVSARFGIASGNGQMNTVWVPITSRGPALCLLLAVLASCTPICGSG